MTTASLETRLARLEAIEDIRTLKSLYCTYCDQQYDPDKLAALFTEDATWHAAHRGRMVGRAAIRDFFAGISAKIGFAAHLVMNDRIEVDGDRATGRWRMVMASMEKFDGVERAVWVLGDYDEVYVREAGGWRIKSLFVAIDLLDPETLRWLRRA